jgi:hypothetical protein
MTRGDLRRLEKYIESTPEYKRREEERRMVERSRTSIEKLHDEIQRWIDDCPIDSVGLAMKQSLESGKPIVADVASRIDAQPTSAGDVSQLPRQKKTGGSRGRRSRFTADQLHKAQMMKEQGKSNNDIAKILYQTSQPTPEQRRSIPTILKYHFPSKK